MQDMYLQPSASVIMPDAFQPAVVQQVTTAGAPSLVLNVQTNTLCGACCAVGTFGRVLECWDRKLKDYVAVKIVRNVDKYRHAAMIEVGVGC